MHKMVYHEVRIVDGKKKNYLVYNMRKNSNWVKKTRFIGVGELPKVKLNVLKKEFEVELIVNKKYPHLTEAQVTKIELLKDIYSNKIRGLSKEEYEKFEESFFTELTYNSNAIEGSSLSLDETSLVVNENLAPEGKTIREIFEAKNHMKALEFIRHYKKDLDELFILKLHFIILTNISKTFAGRYRENPVRIFGGDVKFPDYEYVPQLVKNLIYWYKKNKKAYHPFELAIIFSMKLVTIHPFIDGNGRISRLIMNFILQKYKYPWINVYNKQRAEYLKVVRKANDEDYLPIIEFLINSLEENLKSFGFL